MPNYTIHKTRFHHEQSEETTAFTADLHLDGTKVARVGNDGKGGSHRYDFVSAKERVAFTEWAEVQPCDWEFEKPDQAIDAMLGKALYGLLKAEVPRVNRADTVIGRYDCENAPLVIIGDVLHHAVHHGGIGDRMQLDAFVREAIDASGLLT